MHAHEQDLNCPGCGTHFTRMGGLMSHIELTECRGFGRERLEQARKEKEAWHANYTNARNFQDYGRTAGEFANQSPNPFGVHTSKDKASGVENGVIAGAAQNQGTFIFVHMLL
jgi:hypothetical protein